MTISQCCRLSVIHEIFVSFQQCAGMIFPRLVSFSQVQIDHIHTNASQRQQTCTKFWEILNSPPCRNALFFKFFIKIWMQVSAEPVKSHRRFQWFMSLMQSFTRSFTVCAETGNRGMLYPSPVHTQGRSCHDNDVRLEVNCFTANLKAFPMSHKITCMHE